MEKDYTVNNLIQLIYGECDIFQRLEMEDAIAHNENLKQEYLSLYNAYKALPKVKFSPSNKTMSNIIAFAGRQLNATA